MNYHYCQSCFKKTAQGSDIVKFCAHCGKPLVSESNFTSAAAPKQPNHTIPNSSLEAYRRALAKRGLDLEDAVDENDGDAYDENIRVPNMERLEAEVNIDQQSAIPIRSLAKSAPRPVRTDNKKAAKINKKKFLQEYQRQAAAIRPNK